MIVFHARSNTMLRQCVCRTAYLLIFASVATAAGAAEWGSLKGRVVVVGTPPKPSPLSAAGDQFCIGQKPMDESIVVSEKDGALANVVVYLRLARRETVEAHPDYAAQRDEPVVLDNNACHFVPHVALLQTGQSLVIKNSDPVGHNTKLGTIFNEIIPAGEQRLKTIAAAAVTPIEVSCSIHPFMKSFVLVQDHPYMAVSGGDGAFEIKNVPAGKRSFTFWHEAPGFLRDLKLSAGTTDRRGTIELTIKPGETVDVGDITIPVTALKAR
jgi:hypothetical protein